MLIFQGVTKNNIASENEPSQKETSTVFQPSIFRCYVSLREGINMTTPFMQQSTKRSFCKKGLLVVHVCSASAESQ